MKILIKYFYILLDFTPIISFTRFLFMGNFSKYIKVDWNRYSVWSFYFYVNTQFSFHLCGNRSFIRPRVKEMEGCKNVGLNTTFDNRDWTFICIVCSPKRVKKPFFMQLLTFNDMQGQKPHGLYKASRLPRGRSFIVIRNDVPDEL